MAEKRDYYEVLGIDKNATPDEIKKAYRKKAIQYHPDKNPGDKSAEEKFKEAAEAYDVLSDPNKKARYDQFGHAGMGGAGGFGGNAGGFTMDDIFSQFGDIFGSAFGGGGFSSFGGFGGGRSSGGRRVQKGSDIRIRVKLNLTEIVHGVEKKVKINKTVPCPDCQGRGAMSEADIQTCPRCHGTGYVTRVQQTILGQMQTQGPCPECGGEGKKITNPCKRCNGSGLVKNSEEISFKIPAGVADGMQLTVRGKGNAAPHGGINGDLLVVIEEDNNTELVREGNDLISTLYLSIPDAILGCTAEINGVDGKLKVKIDPGTQPGKVLRLRGKGIPDVNGYGCGDMLIYIQVWMPKKLDKEQKEIIERWRESSEFAPQPDKDDKSFFDRVRKMFD